MIGHLPAAGGSGPAAAGMTVFIDARGGPALAPPAPANAQPPALAMAA